MDERPNPPTDPEWAQSLQPGWQQARQANFHRAAMEFLRPGEPETKLSRLTAAEAEKMIKNGSATGGMIPKLQSITTLLSRGVHSAHILSGTTRNALLSEIFTDSGTGTMIVA